MNTGFQQAIYALKTGQPGDIPLDIDGNRCSETGKKQAIMLLEREENPDPNRYEVEDTFEFGTAIDGMPTRRRNTGHCPVDTTGHIRLNVQSLQLDINETKTIRVDSSHPWRITNLPVQLKISPQGSIDGQSEVSITALSHDIDVSIEFLNVVTGDTVRLSVMTYQLPALPDYPIRMGLLKFDNVTGWPNYWYHEPKDWDYPYNSAEWNMQNYPEGTPRYNQQTVQFVRIGEYQWMRQSPSLFYNGRFEANPQITDEMLGGDLQKYFEVKETAVDFMYKTGAFIYGSSDMTTFMNYARLSPSRSDNEHIPGWKPAELKDYIQVMMQSDNLEHAEVKRFLCAKRNNPNDVTYTVDNGITYTIDLRHQLDDWVNGTDRVKLHLIPAGRKDHAVNNKWMDYREGVYLKMGYADGNFLQFSKFRGGIYIDDDTKFAWGQQRWCRPLTDMELGYRLYIDRANDRIVVKALTEDQPSDLQEVPKGTRLRGRAVRWLDLNSKEVKAPLSHIEAEIATTNEGGSAGWHGFDGF